MRGDELFSHAAIIDLTSDASCAGVTVGVLCRYHPSMPARRFPPPWSVEETAPSCATPAGARLRLLRGFPGRRATGKLLTRDEAADRGERCEAAGAIARAAAEKRGVTRLQPHTSRRSAHVRLDPISEVSPQCTI